MCKLLLIYLVAAVSLTLCSAIKLDGTRTLKNPLSCADPFKCFEENIRSKQTRRDIDYSALSKELLESLSNERLAAASVRADVGEECSLSYAKLAEDQAAGKLYPLKITDSQGRRESGIFEGNNQAYVGRFQECLSIQEDTFIGQYCTADIQVALGGPPGHAVDVGVCFPTTCSVDEATALLQESIQRPYKSSFVYKCQKERYITTYGTKEIIAFCVCGVFGSLVLLSTIYETLANFVAKRRKMSKEDAEETETSSRNTSRSHDVLTSFSVVRNLNTLLSTKQRPGQINCLHGMRFFSMCWVILGHTFSFAENYINNIVPQTDFLLKHVGFQTIISGVFAVDTFFFLSGLLVTYLGMREFSKLKARGNVYGRYLSGVPLSYLLRYLRLTPAFAFCLLFFVGLWPLLGTGPFWVRWTSYNVGLCEKYWWTNLIYIQNIYPASLNDECMGWTWYLANDMQFFLLAPFLLLILYWSQVVGVIVISSVLLISTVITGVFSSLTMQQPAAVSTGYYVKQGLDIYYDRIPSNSSLPPIPGPDKDYGTFVSDLYTKPWIRIGAYMVGMLTGYYLYCRRRGTLSCKLNACTAIIGWLLAAANAIAIIYGLYPISISGDYLSNPVAALYNSTSRPMWCVSLAWVVIACVEGFGGYVDDILSWKGFIPLSRLTYCTYLVHPMVIYLYYAGSSDLYLNYTLMAGIMTFLATVTLSSLVATIVSISIEIPSSTLVKLLMSSNKPNIPAGNNTDNSTSNVDTEKIDYSKENAAAVFEKDL